MNGTDKTHEDEIWKGLYPRIVFLIKKNRWTRQSIGAIFGLGGGIASFLLTMTLQSINWLAQSDSAPLLKEIDFVSLISVLPLLAIGAHFLDLLEKEASDVQNALALSGDLSRFFGARNTKTQ
jgi:hypothetical protein